MILWRIATETRQYAADDMSGGGAAASPGRWNDDKQHVIYAAPTLAVAVLETAAHLDDAGLPLNKYVVRIEVPNTAWDAREIVDVAALPAAWNAIPAGRASIDFGADWLTSGRSPILILPSVIVPEECVALINPQHPLSATIAAHTVRLFEYNRLFRAP